MKSLAAQDVDYILKNLPLAEHLKNELKRQIGAASITISDDIADELRDLCTARLDTDGFDENYEPTEEGRVLEPLIDKLFIG